MRWWCALAVSEDRLGVAPQRVRERPEVVAHLRPVGEDLAGELARPRELLAGVLLGLLARLLGEHLGDALDLGRLLARLAHDPGCLRARLLAQAVGVALRGLVQGR